MAIGWKSSYFRYKQLFLNVSTAYKNRSDLRAFLEIVLSIAAVIVFVLFALKPTALTIIGLLQQIKEEKQTLSLLTKKVNDLQKANTLLVQNQNYLANIDMAISTLPSPDIFAKQMLGLAAKNGVELVTLSIDDVMLVGVSKNMARSGDVEPLPENAVEMSYSVSIKGSFVNINNFMKDFENLRVISKIDNLTINSSETEAGRSIVGIISGRIPYLGGGKQ